MSVEGNSESAMLNLQMTDQELMEQFEHCTLPAGCFGHREHVRVAVLYLTNYPILAALQAFSKALQAFASTHGKPQLYHETITWAYIFIIHERIARYGNKPGWEEFARNNADLLTWKTGILNRYYHEETLKSDLARAIFVWPDRCGEDA
jgi:hypothetical protein